MLNKFDKIITINRIDFFKGNIIDNGMKKEQLIFTNDENFRIDIDEDLEKACKRIYSNYY